MVVIPTYWTWPSHRPAGPVRAVFDHPTPLDGQSTLPHLLDSLIEQNESPAFGVLVLTAATHRELETPAAQQMESIIRPYRQHYPIAQFSAAELRLVHGTFTRQEIIHSPISMLNYANIRNCQLAIPHLLGVERVIALDDDEIVPADYMTTAVQLVNRERPGVAGFYQNDDREIFLPENQPQANIFMDKARIMNAGAKALLEKSGEVVPTPIAFGGNMLFHRDLFSQVPFDPNITRGEDLDYVLNAKLAGRQFWLSKKLRITHRPPTDYDSHPYLKLADDVRRFIYQREKLHQARKRGMPTPTMPKLLPYPGRFLQDDLAQQAEEALGKLGTPDLITQYSPPEQIVTEAQQRATEMVPLYFELAEDWPRLMARLAQDDDLRSKMIQHLNWEG
jgi:hypothetical protein